MGADGEPLNEVTETIGVLKDHTTIADWEAATDEDCTAGWGAGIYAAACSPVGEVYDTADYTDNLTIAGATTEDTHYRRLTVAAGERNADEATTYPKADGGAKNTGYVAIDEGYFEIEYLIVDTTAQSNFSALDVQGGQDVFLNKVIVDAPSSENYAFNVVPGNNTDAVLENCIGIARKSGAGRAFQAGASDGVKFRNCTAYCVGSHASVVCFYYGEPTNCIATVGALGTAYSNPEGSGDYNVGSDATAPGANSIDNIAAADLFADLTADAEDLSLKAAADGSYEGTDLSAYFTDDYFGTTRSDWDIGAHEFAAAGASLVVQDSACIVESETVALTQHHALTVQDSACVVESEAPSLTQHQSLSVDDSACIVESETVALTQHHALTVQDSACVVESEAPSLTQHQSLSVDDSACVVESDNVVLSTGGVQLVVQDSACVVESESPSLTQHHALAVGDSACLLTSENVVLSTGGGFTLYYYLLLAG